MKLKTLSEYTLNENINVLSYADANVKSHEYKFKALKNVYAYTGLYSQFHNDVLEIVVAINPGGSGGSYKFINKELTNMAIEDQQVTIEEIKTELSEKLHEVFDKFDTEVQKVINDFITTKLSNLGTDKDDANTTKKIKN